MTRKTQRKGSYITLLGWIAIMLLLLIMNSSPLSASTGMIPRFVTLKSDEANMRSGPGKRYPIRWSYHRQHLPMEIIDEYGAWRKVRDSDGEEGWMHHSLLSSSRYILIFKDVQTLRRNPDPMAPPVLRAEPMVLARLLSCRPGWCYIQIQGRKGWIYKSAIWGVYNDEMFE